MEDLVSVVLPMLEQMGLRPEPLARLALTPMWAAVLGEKEQSGMAFRFGREHSVYGAPAPAEPFLEEMRPWLGCPLDQVVRVLMGRDDLYSRAFCMAALNALSAPFNEKEALTRRGWQLRPPGELPFLRREDMVVVVGYGYLIDQILEVCPRVHVSDMRPETLLKSWFLESNMMVEAVPDRVVFHDASENEALLAQADVVLVTGSTLVNGTWKELLRAGKRARVKGVFGPSAGLPPEVLQTLGFQYVTTGAVCDPKCFADNLRRPFTEPFSGGCAMSYSLLL